MPWRPSSPAPPLERQAMPGVDGTAAAAAASIVRCQARRRRCRASWRWWKTAASRGGATLAQLQIGAMMDTAGVGPATFAESAGAPAPGWQRCGRRFVGAAGDRDVVPPDSIPEYESLQRALLYERAEVIRGAAFRSRPALLLTRVESGYARRSAPHSVVTLDVTEQEQARSRSEELLREMTSIPRSISVTGIAQSARRRASGALQPPLRGDAWCPPASAAGRSLVELFAAHPKVLEIATEA